MSSHRDHAPIRRSVLLLAALLMACSGAPTASEPTPTMPDLAERLAKADRPAEDKARDAGRRPAAVVAFLGVEPGMTVLDVLAMGGWYSEVLSEAVGPDGLVLAHNIAFVREKFPPAIAALDARIASGRVDNVRRLDAEFGDLGLAPGSVDVAITALNLHDLLNGPAPEAGDAALRAIHRVLVPGGVLGVVDHAGTPGRIELDTKLHRMDAERAVAALERAGFVVEARSDVLRNPEDDRSQNVFAPGLRGRTDRFVLRARKPE